VGLRHEPHVRRWKPVIADMVATSNGDPFAADRLHTFLDEQGKNADWGQLIAVLRRILDGERDESLADGLDAVDAAIVRQTLAEYHRQLLITYVGERPRADPPCAEPMPCPPPLPRRG
jgi:hypothetical protein